MTWKFETSGFDGQCTLFGVNIFQYRWRDCRETAAVIDPHYGTEKVFHVYEAEIDGKILSLAGGSGSEPGTGGMVTKLHAAQIATEAGCEMVIANGWNPDLLYGIVEGEPIGTRFLAKKVSK